jgi:O-antigen/teichoic acid export membrane protein
VKNDNRESSYNHVLKYTGLFGGVQGLNILMGLVRNKLVALLLGPDGMGLASIFNTTVSFISQSTNLGISFSAVKHLSEIYDSGNEKIVNHFIKLIRAWSIVTALLGMIACVFLGPLFSNLVFSWGDHTLHFILLAPAVGLIALTGGETAILKATRQLRSLASIQIYNVFAALVVSVPLYYFFGQAGIVPVIFLMALVTMLFTIIYSFRRYPLQLRGSIRILGRGTRMIKLGLAFVAAGILGSGVEMIVRAYFSYYGSLDVVGFYNAGYMLTVTYAGMVFSAMETDFFPRLSAVNSDTGSRNLTVNRQIEVSILMVSPMLVALMVLLPVLIPLFYSGKFLPVVSMAQITIFSMFFKSVSLPISYLTLAKSDSVAYLVLEGISDVVMVIMIIMGFRIWGLWGAGLGISVAYFIDLFVVLAFVHAHYGYRMSSTVIRYMAVFLPLGILSYSFTFISSPCLYWIAAIVVMVVSSALSLYILRQKTSLWDSLKHKFVHHA